MASLLISLGHPRDREAIDCIAVSENNVYEKQEIKEKYANAGIRRCTQLLIMGIKQRT